MAFDRGELHLNATVYIRFDGHRPAERLGGPRGLDRGRSDRPQTTLGSVYFNETLPVDFPFVQGQVGKKRLGGSSTLSPSATTRARSPHRWTR